MRHAFVVFLFCLTLASPAAELTGGPMLGATDHASTRVWVRATGAGEATLELRTGEGEWSQVAKGSFNTERDGTLTLLAEGLTPETAYGYRVVVDGTPSAAGTLRTLPEPGKGKLRVAFGSCAHLGRFPKQPIYTAIAAAKPDVFLSLGDSIYYGKKDVKSRAGLFAKTRLQREAPDLAAFLRKVPTLAVWDDHDYGPNNSDKTFALRTETREVWTSYWANPSYGEDGDGIYGRTTLGPVDLFLLDDRSFRSPNFSPPGPDHRILGEKQVRWLLRELKASTAPLKLIAVGGQFLSRWPLPVESFELAPQERATILEWIRDEEVRGVVFLSGDVHMAEVLKAKDSVVGYPLYELTSSPLANRNNAGLSSMPHSGRMFVHNTGTNFGWIEVDVEANTLSLEIRDGEGKTLWSAQPKGVLGPKTKPKRFYGR